MSAASSASAFVGRVLIVSNNAVAIGQIKDSLQRFALFPEQCPKLSLALERLNRAKFEAVVIDLQLGSQAEVVLQAVRQAPSNKYAVVFTVSDNRADASGAFRAGSTFVLLRPLSRGLINLSFKAAYGLIVREKRRYFRCPVEVQWRFSEQHCQRFTVPPSMSARVECRSLPMPHWDLATRYSCSSLCQVMNSSLSLKPRCAGRISRRSECGSLSFLRI